MTKGTAKRTPECPSCGENMALQGVEKKSGGRQLETYTCASCHQRKEQVVNESGKRLMME